jgi:vancomycin resistance protein YoaR
MKNTIYIIILFFIILLYPVYSLHAQERNLTIASFSTSIADQDDNVKRNISIACNKLNGIIIPPNSTFSFNDTVGEGSSSNGFMMGRVLYRDRTVLEPGGGLCQVSSTLFNAFLMAGCVIKERYRHFQPVSYVPLGLDATIKYGKKDLRIKNPYDHSIRIEIKTTDTSLLAIILAEKKIKYRYEIFTEEDIIPMPAAEDADRIRQGVTVLVYRKRYIENKLVDSSLLYKDYYPPVYEQ